MFEYMFKRAVYEDARDGKGIVGLLPYLMVGAFFLAFGLFFVATVIAVAIIAYPLVWASEDERPSIQRWIGLTIDDLRLDSDTEFSMPGTIAIITFVFATPLYVFVDGGFVPAGGTFIIALMELGLLTEGVDMLIDDNWQPPE